MSRWRRWSEDKTVGQALLVAGVIILVVQILPQRLLHAMVSLWPLALVATGVALLLGTRARSAR